MRIDLKTQRFVDTERTVHHLMLNALFLSDIGLLKGQMGIVLSLSEYSKYADNDVFSDFADNLLDNVMTKINKGLTYSFDCGLSGIGWGVEYLIQNGFVVGESVDICEEIDQKIMEIDPRRISDLSLESGFEGLLHYIIYHLQGAIIQMSNFPFDKTYLANIYTICNVVDKQTIDESLKLLIDMYKRFYNECIIKNYNLNLIDFVADIQGKISKDITSQPLGLRDGLAGVLLYLMNNAK